MKKVELTYKEVLELSSALVTIGNLNFAGAPLEFLIAISSNQVALESHSKVYRETADKLAKKYAEKGEDNKPIIKAMQIQIADKDYEKYDSNIVELLDKKVMVELSPLSKARFTQPDESLVSGITANILKHLMPILED